MRTFPTRSARSHRCLRLAQAQCAPRCRRQCRYSGSGGGSGGSLQRIVLQHCALLSIELVAKHGPVAHGNTKRRTARRRPLCLRATVTAQTFEATEVAARLISFRFRLRRRRSGTRDARAPPAAAWAEPLGGDTIGIVIHLLLLRHRFAIVARITQARFTPVL